MNYFLDPLKKYSDFNGRARRSEYWIFMLIISVLNSGMYGIDFIVLGASETGYGFLSSFFSLVVFVPSLAVSVRRLHDTGRVGWWYLIAFIPLGGLFLLYFMIQDSEPDNQYGPCPK